MQSSQEHLPLYLGKVLTNTSDYIVLKPEFVGKTFVQLRFLHRLRLFHYLYMFLTLCMCICACVNVAYMCERLTSSEMCQIPGFLGAVVSYMLWVLRIKVRFSVKTIYVLNAEPLLRPGLKTF